MLKVPDKVFEGLTPADLVRFNTIACGPPPQHLCRVSEFVQQDGSDSGDRIDPKDLASGWTDFHVNKVLRDLVPTAAHLSLSRLADSGLLVGVCEVSAAAPGEAYDRVRRILYKPNPALLLSDQQKLAIEEANTAATNTYQAKMNARKPANVVDVAQTPIRGPRFSWRNPFRSLLKLLS